MIKLELLTLTLFQLSFFTFKITTFVRLALREMKFFSLTFSILLLVFSLEAQMPQSDGRVLFGNEWIPEVESVHAFTLADDGIYRIGYEQLLQSELDLDDLHVDHLKLYRLGVEQALYVHDPNQNNKLDVNEYLEFYGVGLKSELHEYLFENPEDCLNPAVNMIADSAQYYLFEEEGASRRYSVINILSQDGTEGKSYVMNKIGEYHDRRLIKNEPIVPGSFESTFAENEGFYIRPSRNYLRRDIVLNHYVENSDDLRMNLRLMGRRDSAYCHFLWQNELLDSIVLLPNEIVDWSIALPQDDFNGNVDFRLRNLKDNRNFNIINFEFEYPQSTNSVPLQIDGTINDLTSSYNVPFEDTFIRIYSNQSDTILYVVNNSDTANVSFEMLAPNSILQLVNGDSSVNYIKKLDHIQLKQTPVSSGSFLIISSREYFDDDDSVLRDYIAYRESEIGGNYDVSMAFWEDIKHDFGYGIPNNFLGIKNYINFLDHRNQIPEHILLIGKGLSFPRWRFPGQNGENALVRGFLPTYGHYGSDRLLVSRSKRSSDQISSVGRLPIVDSDDLRIYLDKIMKYDSLRYLSNKAEDVAWMNNVMHLGGGSSEQATIRRYLENLADTLIQSPWQADVDALYKTSLDPVQEAQSEVIRERINQGVSLLTFFGHSSSGLFDFRLEAPSEYRPNGRYSVLFGMGCLSGDTHNALISQAEQFVFERDGGSMAFLGSSGDAFVFALNKCLQSNYRMLSSRPDLTLGAIQKEVTTELDTLDRLGFIELAEQFTLVGDPALRIGPEDRMDYTIPYHSVQLSNRTLLLEEDSLQLEFNLYNLGTQTADSIEILIELEQEGNWQFLSKSNVSSKNLKQRHLLSLALPSGVMPGKGRLHISIDPQVKLNESGFGCLANNLLGFERDELGYDLVIIESRARFLTPLNRSIVTDEIPQIVIQSDRLFTQSKNYLVEIDTLPTFGSSFIVSDTLQSRGGAMNWRADVDWEYGHEYFIRTALITGTTDSTQWDTRSFVYRPEDQEGWNLSHPSDWSGLKYESILFDSITENHRFIGAFNDYFIRNLFIFNNETSPPAISLNHANLFYNFNPRGMVIAHIDQETYEPVVNDVKFFGSTGGNVFYWVNPDTTLRDSIMQFIDQVDSGDYVIYMPVRKANTPSYAIDEWEGDSLIYGRNLFQVLESQGAKNIRSLTAEDKPYVFVFQKDTKVIREEVGEEFISDLRFNLSFELPGDSGTIEMPEIGPAKEFFTSEWDFENSDSFDILTYQHQVTSDTLSKMDTIESASNVLDLTTVSDNLPIYLKSYLHLKDTLNNTTPDIHANRVYYHGLPEFYFHSVDSILWDTLLQQGEMQKIEVLVGNYSVFDSDSLFIHWSIVDESNNSQDFYQKLPTFERFQRRWAHLEVPTDNMAGRYKAFLELNAQSDQWELIENNNFLSLDFEVEVDDRPPLLAVLFDGEQHAYEAPVRKEVEVTARLFNSNARTQLSDTSQFMVLLKSIESSDFDTIYHNDERLTFQANLEDVRYSQITFLPSPSEQGMYDLRIVAADRSPAYIIQYDTRFLYTLDPVLSDLDISPNPSVHHINISFDIHSSILPDEMSFSLYNMSGQGLGEVDLIELADLNFGFNQFYMPWSSLLDQTSQLRSGQYYYTLKIAKDGETWQKIEDKIIILR